MIEKNWRDLIRPRSLDVEKDTLTPFYGKFVAKPLERGYGLTLGNSLRRVLLSSLQGAAITAARFDGVVHEFSTLPDVSEDVAEILLNLKEVRFQMFTESTTLYLDIVGPKIVTARDIAVGEQVRILNPDQVIATVGKGGKLKGEFKVERGRGYRSSETVVSEGTLPVGWMAVDSFFSPIRRVNYSVTQSRVGQRTDFDRLTFEVWTDGSVKPDDAVALGSKILKDQLSIFLNFDDHAEASVEVRDDKNLQFNANLYRSVDELELSVRSANCLQNANIRHIYDLVQKSEAEMLKTKNFGRKSLNEIKDILSEMGLGLGMKLDGFSPPTTPLKAPDSETDENRLASNRQDNAIGDDEDEADSSED